MHETTLLALVGVRPTTDHRPPTTDHRPPLDERVQKVIALLATDLSRTPTLDQLTEIANVCPRHLERLFIAAKDMSPLQYLKHLRLEKAREDLRHTKKSIKEIRVALGFGDAGTFTQHFKQQFKETPRDYRRKRQPAK